MPEIERIPWRALRVRSRHDRVIAEHLSSRGIEYFAPSYIAKRRWSDRVKQLELPLFPGYVFCRFEPEQKRDVLTTPGVTSIVTFGSVLAEVSEEEIGAVRAIVASGRPYRPWPYMNVGDLVYIEGGCMEGLRGTLARERDEFRVVVNVEILRRSVAVEIDRDSIRPVRQRTA